jgi:small subunit ribosomal protein S20
LPAEKAARQSVKRYRRNRSVRTATRSAISKALEAVESGDVLEAEPKVLAAISVLDRAARKGVLPKKNVDRHKSRIAARLNRLRRA